ncbi:MAG TPA: restriction endonuclease subunit S [Promineifilum sp.]|nr:restriction endonuclease subunit S [Promineifilum sp.]
MAALRRARANLARYKAAVLKAAVEGRLVAQDAADEPASELLARILAERRARWEAAHPGKKYIEPRRPDVDDLPELPEGWVWASFEQLLFSAQNGFGKRNSSIGEPTIVLRLADIAQGGISLENVRRIKMSNEEIEKYQLHEGDLLCLRVNGSPKLVGRMIYIRKFDEDIAFCDHFIRFQPVDIEIAPFIALYFGSEIIRKFVELNMVSSAGQNTVSQRILFDILIPLPPMTEQRLIISELDRRLSIIQTTEQALDANLARAERLRQAVLGKAFRGELV